MPLIKPDTSFDEEMLLLQETGIIKRKTDKVEDRFYSGMADAGLTPEEILGVISQVMNSGQSDGIKLAAAKTALQIYMHPAFVPRRESDRNESPVINFNISGGDVKLQQILTPARSETD